MSKNRSFLYFLLLLPVLFLAFSLELIAQEASSNAQVPGNSEHALNRLIEISAQLSTLNERLQSELQDSRRSSVYLQNMLETSRWELDALRLELAILRQELETLKQEQEFLQLSSTLLLTRAENSQTELSALKTALRKAESSLMSLELSFAAYREAAEGRVNALAREKALWKWGCIGVSVLAVGFGTAFLIAR